MSTLEIPSEKVLSSRGSEWGCRKDAASFSSIEEVATRDRDGSLRQAKLAIKVGVKRLLFVAYNIGLFHLREYKIFKVIGVVYMYAPSQVPMKRDRMKPLHFSFS